MAKNIDPELRKIGDYLKLEDDAIFIVPEYQRAYSWGIGQCDKLWQDITDYAKSDSKDSYFFGTIIVNCQDNDTKLCLIDGQQRTTTFLLLLKALLIRVNEAILRTPSEGDSAGLYQGLKERRRRIMRILYKAEAEQVLDTPNKSKDAELCRVAVILENRSINEQYENELSTILGCVDYDGAEANVVKIKYKQKDNKYTNYFRNFKFFRNAIEELQDSEVNVIAKTVTDNCEVIEIKSWQVEQAIKMFNSLNSDGLPLYDSDIIAAQLYAEAEKRGVQEQFSELWEQLNELTSSLDDPKINLNGVLMQYMYYVRTTNHETVSENGATIVTTPGLRRYFTEINKAPLSDPIKMCSDLLNLAQSWEKVLDYPLMKLLLRLNENSKLFLASYFMRFDSSEITEDLVRSLLDCMLRLFCLLELTDYGYSSKFFKSFLFNVEVQLVDKEVSSEQIVERFDDNIRSIMSRESVKQALLEYDGSNLVYLNEYLFAREHGDTFFIGSKCDIEHIMPASGKNLPEIRKDSGIESEEEFRDFVDKIGNKILLEQKINRSIGNEWFRTKVSTTLENKTGYVNSCYPIARALSGTYKGAQKPYWTKNDIEEATEKASERIAAFIFG